MRGGRKGGLPVCESNGFVSKAGPKFARCEGNVTAEDAGPEKVKHLSAHVAMDEQPPIALPQGFTVCRQQSMSSIADMSGIEDISAWPVAFTATPMPPAAGSAAIDKAIRSTTMVRPTFMMREK